MRWDQAETLIFVIVICTLVLILATWLIVHLYTAPMRKLMMESELVKYLIAEKAKIENIVLGSRPPPG